MAVPLRAWDGKLHFDGNTFAETAAMIAAHEDHMTRITKALRFVGAFLYGSVLGLACVAAIVASMRLAIYAFIALGETYAVLLGVFLGMVSAWCWFCFHNAREQLLECDKDTGRPYQPIELLHQRATRRQQEQEKVG